MTASSFDLTVGGPPAIIAPLFVLLFMSVAIALGYRLLRWLRVPVGAFDHWEHGLVAVTIGAGCLQYLPYTLAAVGWMTPAVVRWSFVLLAVLLIPDFVTVLRAGRRSIAEWKWSQISNGATVWAVLFAMMMALLLVHALGFQDIGEDDGYHLTAPNRWLQLGTLSYLRTYMATNASMGFEMLYAIGLSTGGASAAKLLHYAAGLLAFAGVFLSARRIAGAVAGVTTISLLLIGSPIYSLPYVFGLWYVDLGSCWMAMTSVVVWLAWREQADNRLLVPMALCAGFVGSIKTAMLVFAIGWIPVLMLELRSRGVRLVQGTATILGFGLLELAPVAPWMLRSWRIMGNPLYPMFSGFIPTRDWTSQQAEWLGLFYHYYSWGMGYGERLTVTDRQLLCVGAGILVIGSTAALIFATRQTALRMLALLPGTFLLISIALTGLVFRFWLPGLMIATLVASAIVTRPWAQSAWRFWPASFVLVIALAVQVRSEQLTPQELPEDLGTALGLSRFEDTDRPSVQVDRFLNTTTPRDARVLRASFYTSVGAMSYCGFWLQRTCFTTDAVMQAVIRLDDWTAFQRSIADMGIDYVVISEREFNAGRYNFSFPAGDNEYAFCRRLVDESGDKVAQFGVWQVYHLRHTR